MVRVKQRYLLLELIWHQKEEEDGNEGSSSSIYPTLDSAQLVTFLREESKRLLGVLADCFVIRHVALGKSNTFMIQTNFHYYKQIWMAISLITQYQDHPLYIRVLHISGSIKSAQKAAVKLLNEELRIVNERNVDPRNKKKEQQKQEQKQLQQKNSNQLKQQQQQQKHGIQVLGTKDMIINPDDNIVIENQDFSDDDDDEDDEDEDGDDNIMNIG